MICVSIRPMIVGCMKKNQLRVYSDDTTPSGKTSQTRMAHEIKNVCMPWNKAGKMMTAPGAIHTNRIHRHNSGFHHQSAIVSSFGKCTSSWPDVEWMMVTRK